MTIGLPYSDIKAFKQALESSLGRFSKSITLIDCGPVSHSRDRGEKSANTFTLSLPRASSASVIRDCWKNDRRNIPKAGIVFPDGSLLTVLLVWKSGPLPRIFEPIQSHVEIVDEHGAVLGYISEYSYCFYPNSKLADLIGYFRYDFHIDAMGDGDLGLHSYFHLHRA